MIIFENFQKAYKGLEIIKKSSFTIDSSKVTFFMGPNGAGKTTLIKCLAGLENYNGIISVENTDIDEARKNMFVIWDDCPFYEEMTGLENLIVMSECTSQLKEVREKMLTISKQYFPIELIRRKVKTYSYGQRKKLALILQRALRPQIIVMDEISNGLDFDSMKQLKNDITKMGKNTPIILTGHQFSFYEGLVEDVFIIKNGKIKNVTSESTSNLDDLENIYERHFSK